MTGTMQLARSHPLFRLGLSRGFVAGFLSGVIFATGIAVAALVYVTR